MSKKELVYVDQVNFLTLAGTITKLVAIAYFLGDRGKMGTAARSMMSLGIETWFSSLSAADKKRFEEIHKSVQVADAMKGKS